MAPAQIKQSESKHTAKFGETLLAPFFPGMHEDFGVGLGGKAMAAEGQGFAHLAVVVQFAVKNYSDIVSFVPNGLLTAGQIDNGQAAHAQSQTGGAGFVHEEALAIGTAVRHSGGHNAHARFGVLLRCSESSAANSAH